MGKRKSSKPEPKRRQFVLPTEFDCPMCNFSRCVEICIIRSRREGKIKCRICGNAFSMNINPLMEPADLYCLWMDECESLNKEKLKARGNKSQNNRDQREEEPQGKNWRDDSLEVDSPEHQQKLGKRADSDLDIGKEDQGNRIKIEADLEQKKKLKAKKGSLRVREPVPRKRSSFYSSQSEGDQKEVNSFSKKLTSLKQKRKMSNSSKQQRSLKEPEQKEMDSSDSNLSENDSIQSLNRKNVSKDKAQESEDSSENQVSDGKDKQGETLKGQEMFKYGISKRRKKQFFSDSESDHQNQSELEKELSD